MGWGRYFLLGDIGQQLDLSDQRKEIDEMRQELQQHRFTSRHDAGDLESLQRENDELRLYLTAIVRLLISKGVISREEMRKVINAVDAEDGTQDGRFKGNVL